MIPFRYRAATGTQADLDLLAGDPELRVLAGGTGLVDLMKLRVENPTTVLDINPLSPVGIGGGGEIGSVVERGGELRIGALVRNSALAAHPLVRERYPVLAEALLSGASPQLRNMATLGGNLMQRTRCPYFRAVELPCNKRVIGAGCGALAGHHREHAILGTSPSCIATHPSDMCVALAALDARLHLDGPRGARTVAFADFYRLPGDTPHRETALARDELIVGLTLPPPPAGARQKYLKVRDRQSYEFALASAAVLVTVAGGTIREARVALGGIATIPWRARAAEQALAGQPATLASYRAAAALALAGAKPRRDNEFKVELAQATLVRALELAVGAA